MRLIDADELKPNIDKFIGYLNEDMIARIKIVIDNAPTVEPETTRLSLIDDIRQKQISADKAWLEGYEKGKSERPQGEWILGTPTEYYPEPNPVCPFCNYGNDDTSNYCPRCGARLVIPNG